MNTIKICTPVTANNVPEMISNIKNVEKVSDFIEVRADYISDITPTEVEKIKNEITKVAIFTCRTQQEGGNFKGEEKTRIAVLRKAFEVGFDYVDVELRTIEEHQFNKSGKTKLIISHHNFERTPDYWDISKIVEDIRSYHPDIIKIATMVLEEKDTFALLRTLVNKRVNEQMIVLGMGEDGMITRVLQPYLGGYLTYASSESGHTAPGQIDIKKLEEVFTSINSIS